MAQKNFMLVLVFLLTLTNISACAQEPDMKTNDTGAEYELELVTKGIDIPWGMAWLSENEMLVTDKKGELRMIHGGKLLEQTIQGLPKVNDSSQGGLLDVKVDPDYANNGWIYLSYSGYEGDGNGANTSIMRAKLDGMKLVNNELLFHGLPNTGKNHHYGSRLEFDNQGHLYFSIGDRGARDENPQRLDRDAGKIHRIHRDGSIPKDNPFVNKAGANPSVYSYGHRNPQGMARHPESGDIWAHEHGPKGGDEINLIRAGLNYGWPVISFGVNYSGTSFTDLTEKEGMEQPNWQWTPSIAPSGMTFVTSNRYPQWQGKVLVGSLKFMFIELLDITGDKVASEGKLFEGVGRVRNVKQGRDGFIYIATDGTGIFKVVPKK